MKLSVIIPVLNESLVIDELLDHLQPLRDQGHELILVDGGSSDDTCERARGRVDQLLSSPPGRARQMNLGARASHGDLLWFLHADSRIDQSVIAVLESKCSPDRDCWGYFRIGMDDRRWNYRLLETAMNLRSRLTSIATGDQGIFVRRDVFFAVNCFPEIPLMEDIALSRALKRKARPTRLPAVLVTSARRWQKHGFVRTVLTMWWLRLAFWLGIPSERIARQYPQCSSSRIDS